MPPQEPSSIVNALSFDIEDWFHMLDIPAVADADRWSSLPTLVERYTDVILQIVADHGVKATFFVVGWVAQRYPAIVKRIVEQGHELAAHGYWHRAVSSMTPAQFRDDLSRCVDVLEQQGGMNVLGFRAPAFTITRRQTWAFDVMLDQGLRYDASLCPTFGSRAGYPCPPGPHLCRDAPSARPIHELPMSVLRIGSRGVRFTGGGYLRLLPSSVIHSGIRHLNRRGQPAVVYLHPRDFAVDCPRVPMPLRRRFMSYVGLSTTARKLRSLLANFEFAPCAQVAALAVAEGVGEAGG
jgi:polysaccharide deacetylase family protein (PEP-CTERM system associated)